MEHEKEEDQLKFRKSRIAKLNGGVGIIHIGGYTGVEFTEKSDIIDDAQRGCFSALADGVIPGGGRALEYASRSVIQNKKANDDSYNLGALMVRMMCVAPFQKMAENAGYTEDKIKELRDGLRENNDAWNIYSFFDKKIVSSKSVHVYDPVKVTISALRNSSSVVGELITTKLFQVLKPFK